MCECGLWQSKGMWRLWVRVYRSELPPALGCSVCECGLQQDKGMWRLWVDWKARGIGIVPTVNGSWSGHVYRSELPPALLLATSYACEKESGAKEAC